MRETTEIDHLRRICFIVLLAAVFCHFAGGSESAADDAGYINGFHIRSLPAAYEGQEKLMASLKGSGANTIILDMPEDVEGMPDPNALSNAVYLVHQAGFRIFVIMPTRRSPRALERHPSWEDRSYDLMKRSVESSGRLDLFQNAPIAFLAEQGRVIAECAVDGILLDTDFIYETGDGMGKQALSFIEKEFQMTISPKKLFPKIERSSDGGAAVEGYGAGFWPWAEAKRDRLRTAYEVIREEARKANPGIKIGVPVPIVGPVVTPQTLLARYAFDAAAYRTIGVDLYWTRIDYRDRKADERLTFSESVQALSRSAYAALTSVKQTTRMIIVLQASTAHGKAVPLSEIELTTELVRTSGRSGIVYSITPAAVPSTTLTRKMFRSTE